MARHRRHRKEFEGLVVYLSDCKGDLDKAIKRLNSAIEAEGILDVVMEKRFYEKPSDKKRRKRAEAAYRRQKNRER